MAETVHLYLTANGEDIAAPSTRDSVDSFQFNPEPVSRTTQSGDDEAEDSITIDYGPVKIDYSRSATADGAADQLSGSAEIAMDALVLVHEAVDWG
jgi:hypothetical protein